MKKNKFLYHIKKYKVVLFVVALVLSLVGSYQLYHGKYDNIFKEITIIVYSTFKLFAFAPTNGILNEAPLTYELAIWAAPAFTMVGFFSVFKKIYNSIKQETYHIRKKHMVLIGDNEDTLDFIKNFNMEEPNIGTILLCDISDSVDEQKYHALFTKVVRVDFSNPKNEVNKMTVKDEKIGDYGKIICFENDPKNYALVESLAVMMKDTDYKIDVFIHSQNYRMKELIELKMDDIDVFDIHYFTANDFLVKELFERSSFRFNHPKGLEEDWSKYHFTDFKEIANKIGKYNLLIVGFSEISESFLNQASNILTVNALDNLRVTIIDSDASGKFDKYNDYKTMIDRVIDTNTINLPKGSRLLKQHVLKIHQETPFSAVLFGDSDVNENVFNLDKLVDVLRDVPFAIYAKDVGEIETIVASLRLKHDRITAFGDRKSIMTKSVIIDEQLLKSAKHFNSVYNQTMNDMMGWDQDKRSVEEQWMALSNIKKESSLYQSAHRDTKLRVLSKFVQTPENEESVEKLIKSWAKELEGLSVEKQLQIIEKNPYMNYMTALEHKRWNNFYYMRDFQFGKKDEYLKTHDCLIDNWDEFLSGIQRDKAIYDTMSTLSINLGLNEE